MAQLHPRLVVGPLRLGSLLDGGGGHGGLTPLPPSSPPLQGSIQVDIAAIITATVNAATQGITTEATTQAARSNNTTPTNLSPLRLIHLYMIYGVATDGEIPTI